MEYFTQILKQATTGEVSAGKTASNHTRRLVFLPLSAFCHCAIPSHIFPYATYYPRKSNRQVRAAKESEADGSGICKNSSNSDANDDWRCTGAACRVALAIAGKTQSSLYVPCFVPRFCATPLACLQYLLMWNICPPESLQHRLEGLAVPFEGLQKSARPAEEGTGGRWSIWTQSVPSSGIYATLGNKFPAGRHPAGDQKSGRR